MRMMRIIVAMMRIIVGRPSGRRFIIVGMMHTPA
jgi:hypothetical protein